MRKDIIVEVSAADRVRLELANSVRIRCVSALAQPLHKPFGVQSLTTTVAGFDDSM